MTRKKQYTCRNHWLLGTDDYADADNLYLDSVEIYVPCAANLTFYVGCLDQYSLFQKTSEFERTVHPGKNRLVFTNERIAVPAGYGVFVKWSAEYPVFSGATGQDAQTLVCFASECYQDAAGYSGHPLRPIPYCVPLRFSLAAGTSSKQNTPVNAATQTDAGLIAPDGIKYHLSVGSDGNLYTIRSIPRNVPFPVSWTVKMKKKQKETQDILSYHTQAAGCSDKARAKASGGRQPIEECGRTGL